MDRPVTLLEYYKKTLLLTLQANKVKISTTRTYRYVLWGLNHSMHKVYFLSGFLGSGKTTYAIKMVEFLSKENFKVALIVNEAGEIGIDNQYIKQLGHNVWELFGGCICCSLSAGLEKTIKELEENYRPDVVIIEPSGAADPNAVYDTLVSCVEKEQVTNFFILDPTRIEMFEEILAPLLHSCLKLSNVIIVNKINLASTDNLNKCKRLINDYASSKESYFVELTDPLPDLLKMNILNINRT